VKEFQSLKRVRLDAPLVVLTENTPAALDRALAAFKKILIRGGVFREMKRRAHYVKPSDAKRLKSIAARKRQKKTEKRRELADAHYDDRKTVRDRD
jgi:small subunit ribosomal protein S21